MSAAAPRVDEDHHVHSTYSDDAVSTLVENLEAARRAELRVVRMVDHVRVTTTYVPQMLAALGTADGPDRVLLADHQVPGTDGPWSPPTTVRMVAEGRVSAADVVELVVTGTLRAVERAGRAQVAHPFSVLPKVGLTEDDVPDALLDDLARVLVATGTPVEVNEKWRCPGPRVTDRWRAAGVTLVASTDAHHADDVGVYRWVGVP